MAIQIIGTKKCNETKKAVRFFKERRADFHFVDLQERPLSRGELGSIARNISLDALVDIDSKEFKKRNLQFIQYNPEEVLIAYPLLMKTPVIRKGNRALLGASEDDLKSFLE